MNKYNKMINEFNHSSPLSKKALMNSGKMKKGNFNTHSGAEDEFLYLNYENWFSNLEDWYKNNVSGYSSLKLNHQLFLHGGKDITINVIKEIFDRYKINPVLSHDIINYLSVKTAK